jgi:CheY-like chemotaxis protein
MDDEAPIREVVSAMLSTHGFDVHCTASADETVAAWSRAHEFGAPFDLLLADLDIRGGPGACEVMTQLRSRFPHIRAILTSGYADDEIMESFRSHGFLGILSKPFQMERLVQSVRQLLGS